MKNIHYDMHDRGGLKSSHFRPTIVILVNDAGGCTAGIRQAGGKSIYEYLYTLLLSLDEVFYPGIALLVCDEYSLDASIHPLEKSSGTAPSPSTPVNLAQMLRATLNKVQSSRLLRRVEQAGYIMPDSSPQIYIVGRAQSSWVSTVVEQVIAELGEERGNVFLAYLLIDAPDGTNTATPPSMPSPPPDLAPPDAGPLSGDSATAAPPIAASPLAPLWSWDLLPQVDALPKLDYCFLYERREGSTRTYVEDPDARFSIAETLLALIGTDFSFSSLFREHVQLPIVPWRLKDRIGCLGTSRALFPQQEIEQYCGNLLGAELMLCQLEKLQQPLREGNYHKKQRETVRASARQDVEEIEHRLGDTDPRPYFPEYSWPSLQFLEDEEAKQQLQIATENIFQHFDASRKMNLMRRAQLGLIALGRWQVVAVQIWQVAGKELQQQFQTKVHSLLDEDDSGQMARLYAACFDDQLNHLRDQFMDLRVKHKDQYDQVIAGLRARSAPWRVPTQYSALTPGGSAQATPQASQTMINPDPAAAGGAGSAGEAPPPLPSAPSQSRMGPLPEKELVENLQQRMAWMKTRIPSLLNLFGVGLAILPALILLVLDLFAFNWLRQPALFLMLVGGCVGVFLLICLLLRLHARKRLRRAEADLFYLHLCHFAYFCEEWEDRRRIVLLGQLIPHVRRIRARIENMAHFTEHLSQVLKDEAERVERELFDSAQAYRDVFIGDRNILGHDGNSLSVINERIHQLRQSVPREEWHQSIEQLNNRMQRELFNRGISTLTIQSEQDLIQPMRDFCARVLRPYFLEVANLSFLLNPDDPQTQRIWQQLLKYATVLYMPDTPSNEHLVFCAQSEQLGMLSALPITHNAQLVGALSRSWMMVIHFWPGGSPSQWTVLPEASSQKPLTAVVPPTPNWSKQQP